MKQTRLQRKTPLLSKTPLRRSQISSVSTRVDAGCNGVSAKIPLRSNTAIAAGSGLPKRSKKYRDTPAAIRKAVSERSRGVCEACGQDAAEHVHHRLKRSQGGRHDLANLLHVSAACHARIHENRDSLSYGLGLLVARGGDSASVPVYFYAGPSWLPNSEPAYPIDEQSTCLRCGLENVELNHICVQPWSSSVSRRRWRVT